MGHAQSASFEGIPLVYMGDDIALLNDYGYTAISNHAHDSRWLRRIFARRVVAELHAAHSTLSRTRASRRSSPSCGRRQQGAGLRLQLQSF